MISDSVFYWVQTSTCIQGLIQSIYELHDGSGVVVTIGKYVTPNHKDINGNGIEPDFQRLPGILFSCNLTSANPSNWYWMSIIAALREVSNALAQCQIQKIE